MPRLNTWRHVYQNAGAPSAGTDEVQTLTFGGTWLAGDTFVLSYQNVPTAAIAWSATNATLVANIDAALGALADIGGAANVTTAAGTMTSGIGTITLTFAAALGKLDVPTVAVGTLTTAAGTLANAVTTPGVTATGKGLPPGALVVDTTNAKAYINTGTAAAPTWTVVGAQS
jgi:hypothetical protein